MIPTIYPTIFLDFHFHSKGFDIFKYHKLAGKYTKGSIASNSEADHLYSEPLNTEGIIAKYYPELSI
jgi:hypothetical protein